MADVSAEDYTKAITKALENQDVKAVPGLLALMAIRYPREAEELRQTLLLGLTIAARRGGA